MSSSMSLEHDRKTLARSVIVTSHSHKSSLSRFCIEQISWMNRSLWDQSSSFKMNIRLFFKNPPSASWCKMLRRLSVVSSEWQDVRLIINDLSTIYSLNLRRITEMKKSYLISSSKWRSPNSISQFSILNTYNQLVTANTASNSNVQYTFVVDLFLCLHFRILYKFRKEPN